MNCYRCETPIPAESRYCFACGADVSGDTAQGNRPVVRDPELEAKLAAELEGDFLVERLIGRGGMALVFLARDLQLDRKVAIKLLPPELSSGPGMIERFKREARTAATLDHPHIVPIYRIAKSGTLFWFAMKYLVGESLGEVLEREKSLPADRSAAILTQVAEALEFAHEHHIIHRDVKPVNVMIDQRGWVTVTDFGIAKAIGLQSLTSSDSIIGTPYYISPEQCSGKTTLTGASDQYSLAVMAYQMLSGQLPFTGRATVEIIKQHCFDPPPPLDVVQPGLPPGLANVVECALAKTPEERFPSVAAFAEAFAAAALGTGALPPLPVRKRRPAQRDQPGSWPRRRRIFLGILASVTALSLVGAWLWQRTLTPPDAVHPPAASALPRESVPALLPPASDSAAQHPAAPLSVAAVPPPAITAASRDTARAPKLKMRDARLFLRGVSEGATITVDGRLVTDSVLYLHAPASHVINVIRPGFAPWADTLLAEGGDQFARWVTGTPSTPARVAAVPDSAPRAPAAIIAPLTAPPAEAVLRIQVVPPARILIDRINFGEQRALVHSVVGGIAHLISVVPIRSGYSRKDTTVTPRPGDTVTVHIRLEAGP